MEIQDWTLKKATITGPIRWFGSEARPILYMAETGPLSSKVTFRYKTTLHAIPGVLPAPPGAAAAAPAAADPLASSGGFAIPQLLSPAPAWDLAPGADGTLMVAGRFGGGRTQLLLQAAGGEVSALTEPGDLASYSGPRFARQGAPGAGALVTAISDQNEWLLWDRASETVTKLGEAQDGLVVEDQGRFALFRNGALDDTMSALGENPGRLSVELSSRLTGTSSGATPILGGSLVYDFDAVAADGQFVVLAATNRGPVLVVFEPSGETVTELAWPDSSYPPSGTWAWSPSLLAGDGAVYFAFVEYRGTEPSGIRAGLIVSPAP